MVCQLNDRRHRLREKENQRYSELHEQMIKTCKDIAAQGPSETQQKCPASVANSDKPSEQSQGETTQMSAQLQGPQQSAVEMIDLLSPWRKAKTVQDTPSSIVEDLLMRQQALEERILQRKSLSHLGWNQSLVFVILIGLTTGIAFFAISGFFDENLVSWSRAIFYSTVNRIAQTTLNEKLILSAVAVWLFGSALLWSTIRR